MSYNTEVTLANIALGQFMFMKIGDRGIESRVMFVALAPVIATALALTLYFTLLRYNDVESSLKQRGITMASQLVPATQYGLFSGNIVELQRLLKAVSSTPDVSAITVFDQHGKPLAIQGQPRTFLTPSSLPDGWSGQISDGNTLAFHNKVFAPSIALDDPYTDSVRTTSPNLLLGSITVELSRNSLIARKREILFFTLAAVFLIFVVAGAIAYRLGRDITEPVLALQDAIRRIREGRLESRVPPHPAATLRDLEEGINNMAAALEAVQQRTSAALSTTEKKLQQQSNFAAALVEAQSNAGVGTAIIENGKAIFMNQPAQDFLGRDWETIYRSDVMDFFSPQQRDAFERHYGSVFQGNAASILFEVNLTTPDGHDRWAEVAAFSMIRNNVRQIAMIGIDTTQRKQDALKLLQVHEELRLQRDDAQRANTAKSRFLAAASHDLRQPLHALTLFSDQLRERVITPEQHYLSEQMRNAIGSMSELLESLTDISRTDLTTLHPEIRPVELAPLLEQVASAYWQTAADKGVRLTVAKTSLWIASDPRYLRRILSNLVANAVRYTERGAILLGARRNGLGVHIEIWDTGIGIDNDALPLVFQEFYQVANPERDPRKGLGLGLSIVERLCKALGLGIHVRSIPTKGTVFRLHAPRSAPQLPLQPANEAVPVRSESNGRILIAIDASALRAEVSELVANWGYSVELRSAGLDLQMSSDARPDLVISDKTRLEKVQETLSYQGSANSIPIVAIGDAPITIAPDNTSITCMVLPLKPAKLRALLLHLLAA